MQTLIKNYEPTVVGEEISQFLTALVASLGTDPHQERWVEFHGAGFKGLRRTELVRLARRYGLDIDENLAHMHMLPIFEGWWNSGKFPKVKKATTADDITRQVLENLKKDPAALRALAEEAERDAETQPDVSDPASLKWNDLQKYARSRGVDVLHKNREQILEALKL